MRNHFAQEITELAGTDDRIVMMMADIGNRLFNDFRDRYPDRFFNCGVAEANMIGMAAGLAARGLRPICYTITPFVTARCYEQIKVDVAYHEMPVTIVGTGSGLSYASLGATHHSLDDLGLMRMLPGFAVLNPGDALEVRACLRLALSLDGPAYIRIGKKAEPTCHEQIPDLRLGGTVTLRSGNDVLLLASGNVLPEALSAADRLESDSISAAVASAYSVKPLDIEFLTDAFQRYAHVVIIEEHFRACGYGSAVAEWVLSSNTAGCAPKLVQLGAADYFLHEPVEQGTARSRYGLDAHSIARCVIERMRSPVAGQA